MSADRCCRGRITSHRQHQHADAVVVHRDPHRQLVDHDPDHGLGQAHRFAADPRVVGTVARHRRQGIPDQPERAALLEVEGRHVGPRRDVDHGAARLVGLDQHHGVDTGVVEQRPLDVVGHDPVGCRVERQRRQGAALDQLLEIDQPVARDRWQEQQQLGGHHPHHHQPEDPPRQAEGRQMAPQGRRSGAQGDVGGHVPGSLSDPGGRA
jgi:hypothetical protein